MAGPLSGVTVIELAGIGPGPMCAMLLADLGADVIRVDRIAPADIGIDISRKFNILHRGRRSIGVDLKSEAGVATVLELIEHADVLIEGFRPGVTERLGLGPDECLARNPRLVYGRMTGWGQEGPLAQAAGHDINYIALTGALAAIGERNGPPVAPLNLVGDFGGGALYLAFGICAALFETSRSGAGQVVDAAMVDGAASLMTLIYGMYASGDWTLERGANLLDNGPHFYGTYECADGEWISVGSLEQRFHDELLAALGLTRDDIPDRFDRERWPAHEARLAAIFRTKTREAWCDIMEGTDICFAPVLSLAEAPHHPHNVARNTFVEIEGVVQPGPAPRFSRTAPETPGPVPPTGGNTDEVLTQFGWTPERLERLRAAGVIGPSGPPTQ